MDNFMKAVLADKPTEKDPAGARLEKHSQHVKNFYGTQLKVVRENDVTAAKVKDQPAKTAEDLLAAIRRRSAASKAQGPASESSWSVAGENGNFTVYSHNVLNDIVGMGIDNVQLFTMPTQGTLVANKPTYSIGTIAPAPVTQYVAYVTQDDLAAQESRIVDKLDSYLESEVNGKLTEIERHMSQLQQFVIHQRDEIAALKYELSVIKYQLNQKQSKES